MVNVQKRAIRALGLAESFRPSAKKSTLAGVVMRTDLVVDGFVLGSATVGGTQTTHIRATVNVPALLRDLNTFLERAASLGISGTSGLTKGLSASTQQHVASEIHNPSFDLWTGNRDKTVRRLQVGLSLPVSGQIATLLGGLKKAGISLTLQYSDLNQPQTITAPTRVQPYSVFSSKLDSLLQVVESGLSSGALGSGTSTSSGSTSGAAGATSAYSQCLQKAGQDVAKMQQCASKLNNGG